MYGSYPIVTHASHLVLFSHLTNASQRGIPLFKRPFIQPGTSLTHASHFRLTGVSTAGVSVVEGVGGQAVKINRPATIDKIMSKGFISSPSDDKYTHAGGVLYLRR